MQPTQQPPNTPQNTGNLTAPTNPTPPAPTQCQFRQRIPTEPHSITQQAEPIRAPQYLAPNTINTRKTNTRKTNTHKTIQQQPTHNTYPLPTTLTQLHDNNT